jgi:hypothetical protein
MFNSYAYCSYDIHLSNLYHTNPSVVTITLVLMGITELVNNYFWFRCHTCLMASHRFLRKKFYLFRKC